MFFSFSEIEKSGTIPVAKSSEAEPPEAACEAREALELSAPAEQPVFVSTPGRCVWPRSVLVAALCGIRLQTFVYM